MREKKESVEITSRLTNRSVNEGFSGGEKKKNEIFQMAMLQPKLAILDETDSGLDIDALRTVAEGVEPNLEDVITRRSPWSVALHIVNDEEVCRCEVPGRACPGAVGIGAIGLINTPIVGCIPLKLSGIITFGAKASAGFLLECTCIGAKVNFMRGTKSRCPCENRCLCYIHSTINRIKC